MMKVPPGDSWNTKFFQPHWPWGTQPVRPADVGDELSALMLARENLLEDVNYRKIAPNRYIIEINEENYTRNFKMIEKRVLQQWSEKLLDELMTANSRLGRREYNFGGRLQIEIRPVTDLQPNQMRVLYRIQAEEIANPTGPVTPGACLELMPGRRRWNLRQGVTTIGRNQSNDIALDIPEVQEKRLISGQHAYIYSEQGKYRLFDGSPTGKASVNGTYVNYQPVLPGGHVLQNGDFIILAATEPGQPRPGVAGTVSFYFYLDCKGS